VTDQLGFDVSSPEAFWISEFTKVTAYWKNRSCRRLAWSRHRCDL